MLQASIGKHRRPLVAWGNVQVLQCDVRRYQVHTLDFWVRPSSLVVISLAMCHRLSGLSSYGLKALVRE